MARVRTSFLCAVLFTAGLLCGNLMCGGLHDRNAETVENLLRVKCLHGLAADFRHVHERWPKSLEELQEWCGNDALRRTLFGRSSHVYAPDPSSISWTLLSDPKSGEFGGFASGSRPGLRCEYGISADGGVWVNP